MGSFNILPAIFLIMGLISSSSAGEFYVGGSDGWIQNPKVSYNSWAQRMRFQINDKLAFKYKKGDDSVLVVKREDYDTCNVQNPIQKLEGGDSVFQFDRSGLFYFISGVSDRCSKGEKLVVLVMADRTKKKPLPPPPQPLPQPPVSSPPSASMPPSPSPMASPSPSSLPPPPMASPSPSSLPSPPMASPSPSPALVLPTTPSSTPGPAPASTGVSPTPSPMPVELSPQAGGPSSGGGGGGSGGPMANTPAASEPAQSAVPPAKSASPARLLTGSISRATIGGMVALVLAHAFLG